MREPPAGRSDLRFGIFSLWRSDWIVDAYGRYRCQVCDAVIGHRKHRCPQHSA